MWICTGLIVFEETRFYSNLELLGIFGSITACCIGIKFLTMKTKLLKDQRQQSKLQNWGHSITADAGQAQASGDS